HCWLAEPAAEALGARRHTGYHTRLAGVQRAGAAAPPDGRHATKTQSWGGSSAGRALRSQCRGRGFDPLPLHQFPILRFVPIYPNGYAHGMKPIRFAGDALTELRAFPQAARHDAVANCTRSNVADNRTT